jgi:hypothetical protein
MPQTPTGSRAQIRLAESYRTLEAIERDRRSERNPRLGKAIEQRIIHRELLELELQELDEQMDRLRDATSRLTEQP